MIIKFMKEIGIRSQNWSPSDIPKNINEALGYDLTDKHTTVASYGGVNQTSDMHHGQVENQMKRISIPKSFSLCRKTINDNYSSIPVLTYTGCITRASESFIR
jgi:hypothetical protein